MIEIAGATNELAAAPTAVAQAPREDAAALHPTYVAVVRAKWSVLALVGTEPGAPTRAVAAALVETARSCRLPAVRVLHASGATAAQLALLADELAGARDGETRTVITVDDPQTSPGCGPLLVGADAAVLLVRLGTSTLRSVEAAVELAGRERVLGCIIAR
jgi:hypothetical protein